MIYILMELDQYEGLTFLPKSAIPFLLFTKYLEKVAIIIYSPLRKCLVDPTCIMQYRGNFRYFFLSVGKDFSFLLTYINLDLILCLQMLLFVGKLGAYNCHKCCTIHFFYKKKRLTNSLEILLCHIAKYVTFYVSLVTWDPLFSFDFNLIFYFSNVCYNNSVILYIVGNRVNKL